MYRSTFKMIGDKIVQLKPSSKQNPSLNNELAWFGFIMSLCLITYSFYSIWL